jgi:hypothetical protein
MRQLLPLNFGPDSDIVNFTNGGYNVVYADATTESKVKPEDEVKWYEVKWVDYTLNMLALTICCPVYCLCYGDQTLPWMRDGTVKK